MMPGGSDKAERETGYKYISAFPTINPVNLIVKKKPSKEHSFFDSAAVTYHFRGANAIFHGVKLLELKDDDVVLVPAFHCGVEIEALLAAGVKIKYYNIFKSLQIDVDDLKQKISPEVKAVFVIHYFGFPQPIKQIKDICEEKNIYLIEDCAHALYSKDDEHLLGSYGDISIFSFQKTLPVPDGGALVVNIDKAGSIDSDLLAPNKLTIRRGIVIFCLEHIKMFHPIIFKVIELFFVKPVRFLLRTLRKKSSSSNFEIKTSNTQDFDINLSDVGMSDESKKILKLSDNSHILNKRRDNYLLMLRGLKSKLYLENSENMASGLSLLRGLAPDSADSGICPLFFPVFVERRDEVQQKLKDRGISIFIFGKTLHESLPENLYPDAELLSERNLCLPIHQDLGYSEIQRMVSVLATTCNMQGCE